MRASSSCLALLALLCGASAATAPSPASQALQTPAGGAHLGPAHPPAQSAGLHLNPLGEAVAAGPGVGGGPPLAPAPHASPEHPPGVLDAPGPAGAWAAAPAPAGFHPIKLDGGGDGARAVAPASHRHAAPPVAETVESAEGGGGQY